MIRGQKVTLRPLKEKDLLFIYKWVNNPKVIPFWYGRNKPRSMMWIKKHYKPAIKGKFDYSYWIIEVKGRPIGYMGSTIYRDDDDKFSGRVELDIFIGEDKEWGKGFGTDALQAMTRYAFGKQKAERVFIMPRVSNTRAIHLYQKVGFKKEGVLRHFEKFEGRWIDCLMMSIIREEFKG